MKCYAILACVALLALCLSPAAAQLKESDLQGTWNGHCIQYASYNSTTNQASCIPYNQPPLRFNYLVTYQGNNVSISTGSPLAYNVSGVVRSLTKYKTLTCASVNFDIGQNASYTLHLSGSNVTSRTLTVEGALTIPDNMPLTTCVVKSGPARLYCEKFVPTSGIAKYNYICTLDKVSNS